MNLVSPSCKLWIAQLNVRSIKHLHSKQPSNGTDSNSVLKSISTAICGKNENWNCATTRSGATLPKKVLTKQFCTKLSTVNIFQPHHQLTHFIGWKKLFDGYAVEKWLLWKWDLFKDWFPEKSSNQRELKKKSFFKMR